MALYVTYQGDLNVVKLHKPISIKRSVLIRNLRKTRKKESSLLREYYSILFGRKVTAVFFIVRGKVRSVFDIDTNSYRIFFNTKKRFKGMMLPGYIK